jgi:transcriptional regulator with XRE-family HTH domain
MTGLALGKKIRDLRITNGLTQEELANRCELSKGFISQLEGDQTSPSIATLIDILECLGTDVQSFFSEKPEEKIVFTPADYFEKEDEEQGHRITWIVPNSQKNNMEPIILELAPGGISPEDDPHGGQEFGYVLSGTVTVHTGDKSVKAKKGDCFYYSTDKEHYIENKPNKIARVLWVSAPPSF